MNGVKPQNGCKITVSTTHALYSDYFGAICSGNARYQSKCTFLSTHSFHISLALHKRCVNKLDLFNILVDPIHKTELNDLFRFLG